MAVVIPPIWVDARRGFWATARFRLAYVLGRLLARVAGSGRVFVVTEEVQVVDTRSLN